MTATTQGEPGRPPAPPREFRLHGSSEPEWTDLIQKLWDQRRLLVSDFLERFSAVSYGDAQVPEWDVHRTAVDTMDMFLLQMAGLELPDDLKALPREVAIRRARQGVPLDAFLEAVRNDFRVLWKGLERVAGEEGVGALVANMDRILDTVEGYVSNIQQAYAEEEALLTRDRQLYRQRLLSRLFNTDLDSPNEVEDMAGALGLDANGTFEVLAVTSKSLPQAQRQYASDYRTCLYENAGSLYLFRHQRKGKTWQQEHPEFPAGYVPDVTGLASVPAAAASALALAEQNGTGSGLSTMQDAWMRIASGLLEDTLPGFSDPVKHALDRCSPHERHRLLQVARSYARTGSIKETAAELYCHRNTVVNRLHSLQDVIGLDLTVPAQAALALVSLSRYEASSGAL
ncbi:PucR family transcriptional regulator [Arthrobacter sp. BB-1]|uniref:helix-turn-helix domain-containing protein n=1 Tax=unclassified Arthrobacter TaxID=235627 RepID=UPI001112AD62|nr:MULTISPECIES: helix-turn-helix domain-containing protein [unclassified Arthrobacter]TNB69872.1 PucR family transcriptional regulator [Arthrobacter sp. BB-1]